MDYSSVTFVDDLRNGLRSGMTEALRQFKLLKTVEVSGVERTLYPMIREYTLKYLDSLGYGYLVNNPIFFVIGETSITGTTKKADGFICDVESGKPAYAIEIGISNTNKFRYDYKKCVNEWARTGILGVFILYFDTDGSDEEINFLDGSVLRTPKNEDFLIYPLILPLDPNAESAFESITLFRYFMRHQNLTYRMITLSDRIAKGLSGQVTRWTTDMISPLLEKKNKLLLNRIFDTTLFDGTQFQEAIGTKPNLVVLQGGINPFKNFDNLSKEIFIEYLKKERPKIVIFADWLESSEWENDPILNQLLPIEFIGKNHSKGKWDNFDKVLRFGQEITLGTDATFDLSKLSNSDFGVTGFCKTKLKQNEESTIEMYIEKDNIKFPFIVRNREKNVVFVSSGTGVWGVKWLNYPEGYQLLWSEILFNEVSQNQH